MTLMPNATADAIAAGSETSLGRPLPAWRRLVARPAFTLSLAFLAIVIVTSVFAPILAPHDPLLNNLGSAGALPSPDHLLGTDYLGRDILSRLMFGGLSALGGALFCVLVAMLVGVPTGIAAGYIGGLTDSAGSTFSNLFQALPGVVAMLMAVSIFGTSVWVGMGVLGFLLSAGFFRLARNGSKAIRRDLFVDAARVAGVRGFPIMTRHVLPNIARPIIVQASLTATVALLLQAGLAFLGQGTPPPAPSWGGMVKEATDVMFRYPWIMVPTGGTIALVAIAFSLLGDVLSDDALPRAGAPRALSARGPRERAFSETTVPQEPAGTNLLVVKNLTVAVAGAQGDTILVDRMSLSVAPSEAVALVGESGCGKTMTALAILGLLPGAARVTEGSIQFGGQDLASLDETGLSLIRGSRIGFVSQEPIAALDPCFTVGSQILEPLRRHTGLTGDAAKLRMYELLALVEIARPEVVAASYPHELSGGMAQRVSIAIALSGNPRLIIADEPTTALDVTVQAEILDLLRGLQARTGIGLLLVTHDLGVVADIAQRAVVMYAGHLVEEARVAELFEAPHHPYTRGLLASAPRPEHAGHELPTIPGSVPPPGSWPVGCRFANRCPFVVDACRERPIELVGPATHPARCIRVDEIARGVWP